MKLFVLAAFSVGLMASTAQAGPRTDHSTWEMVSSLLSRNFAKSSPQKTPEKNVALQSAFEAYQSLKAQKACPYPSPGNVVSLDETNLVTTTRLPGLMAQLLKDGLGKRDPAFVQAVYEKDAEVQGRGRPTNLSEARKNAQFVSNMHSEWMRLSDLRRQTKSAQRSNVRGK